MSKDHHNPTLRLKRGRQKSLGNRHPWIFSGAVASTEENCEAGSLVTVLNHDGKMLGSGFYNPDSQIRVRMLDFGAETAGDSLELLANRIEAAVLFRSQLFKQEETNAFRLINAEGDFLGGLIVDYYAGYLVIQPLARWLKRYLHELLPVLEQAVGKHFPYHGVLIREEEVAMRLEGMGPLDMTSFSFGPEPEDLHIRESALQFKVDLVAGQKTGFFLDQRENRLLAESLSRGSKVLNLFAYSGGFTLPVLRGGAREVLNVDISAKALKLLEVNVELNGFSRSLAPVECADIKTFLPAAVSEGRSFDLVICDPPPFARRRQHIRKASRAYKDINRRAMQLIDDGWLMTFSCSPHLDAKLFRQILFAAGIEADRKVQLVKVLGPGADHPVDLNHPEGDYLNGLLLRVEL